MKKKFITKNYDEISGVYFDSFDEMTDIYTYYLESYPDTPNVIFWESWNVTEERNEHKRYIIPNLKLNYGYFDFENNYGKDKHGLKFDIHGVYLGGDMI